MLWRHLTNAVLERTLKFRKLAQLVYTLDGNTEYAFDARSLGRMADTARRNAPLAVSTTLLQDVHEGRTIIMGGAGAARTFTLPNATGSGAVYHLTVGAVNTSGYLLKTSRGADTFDGSILQGNSGSSGACRLWNPGATDDTITLNGTTTGGVAIGDWIEVQDIAANQWAVTGVVTCSGVAATMFSDTVA